ncbi:MAG: hypothetical protein J4473_05355 [Candidatus Aenigmarchaeota archaeon]|nr:hypothetical protein [Candidatus Aenigmarchaeota archaeon]
MTKIEIKEDKGYQKFLRGYNKFLLIFLAVPFVLGILSSFLIFPITIVIIFFILFGILFVIDIALTWIFYKTFKYVKKANSKLTPKEKRRQAFFLFLIIVLGLVLWCAMNYLF